MTGKTLKELNVKVGDVVSTERGTFRYTVALNEKVNMCDEFDMVELDELSGWHLISRAKKNTAWQFTPARENAETHTMPDGSIAWRVVVEPVVETVHKYRHADNGGWTDIQYCKDPSHRLTYNTIDGAPDCASVKMELL